MRSLARRPAARLAAGVIFICSFGGLPAAAQSELPIERPTALIDSFSPAQITAFLGELDISVTERTTDPDYPFFIATLPSGGQFIFAPRVVDMRTDECCLGLDIFRFFEPPPGRDLRQAANSFNTSFPFAKVYISGHDRPVVSRYIIADGGITRANLFYNLTNFLGTSQSFLIFMNETTQGVSLPGAGGIHAMHQGAAPVPAPDAPGFIDAIEADLQAADALDLDVQAEELSLTAE